MLSDKFFISCLELYLHELQCYITNVGFERQFLPDYKMLHINIKVEFFVKYIFFSLIALTCYDIHL